MAERSSPNCKCQQKQAEVMKKGHQLGLDELMIVNPGPLGGQRPSFWARTAPCIRFTVGRRHRAAGNRRAFPGRRRHVVSGAGLRRVRTAERVRAQAMVLEKRRVRAWPLLPRRRWNALRGQDR